MVTPSSAITPSRADTPPVAGVSRRPQIFLEPYPFHSQTLWCYFAEFGDPSGDVVLANSAVLGEDFLQGLPAPKQALGLATFWRALRQVKPAICHLNSIFLVLYPITTQNLRRNLAVLFVPVVARLHGCRNAGVVHEADLFFATGVDYSRRRRLFRQLIGQWYIRLFDECFVLSPEVQAFVSQHGNPVSLLDAMPLVDFPISSEVAATIPPEDGIRYLAWIGTVDSWRRTWRPLLTLDPELLARARTRIVMLGDGREAEAPQLRAALDEAKLMAHFTFMDRRPGDAELLAWVGRSAGVLCLSADSSYGTTKTSGARAFAHAFRKPFIVTQPRLAVHESTGDLIGEVPDLSAAVALLLGESRSPVIQG
jgi:hypothetical protein